MFDIQPIILRLFSTISVFSKHIPLFIFLFSVPHDPETEDTDMMRIIGRWFGFDWEWMKHFTPYAQVILIFTYRIVPSSNMRY